MVTTDTTTHEALRRLGALIEYLQVVRETRWSHRLEAVREALVQQQSGAARNLAAVFEGEDGFDSLYLSGPRFGHNVSERQEIEANGKLHLMRAALRSSAQALSSGTPASM